MSGVAPDPLACAAAQRNSEVSRPSRATARNAVTTRRQRAHRQGGVELALQVGLEEAGGAAHPEDHPRDETDRDDGHHPAEALLRLEAQVVAREGQQGTEGEADHQRHRDTDPHEPHPTPVAGLDQVGDQDADDQRRLEAFAQADEVVGEHANGPSDLGR